jgi:hypothetical protein
METNRGWEVGGSVPIKFYLQNTWGLNRKGNNKIK